LRNELHEKTGKYNNEYFVEREIIKEIITDRFIRYARYHTTSDPTSNTFPSNPGEVKFSIILAEELESIGLKNVEADENGYVTATIPSNIETDIPVVGFIAHMDTSPDFTGEGVNPQIIQNYQGHPIILSKEPGVILDPSDFPELRNYVHQTLIITDGTTLLGADDKAGIAEIITAAEILVKFPQIQHGEIRLCFTPDEEIGRGADRFNLIKLGANFAFTVDGGEIGELEYENFNAARAAITIQGKSVHPGEAKGKMVNALLIAQKILDLLPENERPDNTEGLEGFYHLVSLQGNVENADLELLVRDHDKEKFELKKQFLEEIAIQINGTYKYPPVVLKLQDQYYNMREKIDPNMYIVELAFKAMLEAGVTPKVKAVRGGTDGARLSWMGLPCPNIFTGGHNFHGPYEYIPVESMVKAVEVILNICRNTASLPVKSEK
jgi:tripeptide aminopeptidase